MGEGDSADRYVRAVGSSGPVEFDLQRLRRAEREVWDEMFADGFPERLTDGGRRSPALALYSFAHACNLYAYGFPPVVSEWMAQLGSDPQRYTEALERQREGHKQKSSKKPRRD